MRVLALGLNTFREAIRNKVLYVLLLFAVALIAGSIPVSQGALHEQMRVTRDVGLGGIELVGVLLAIFIGVNLVYKEIERKTVFALIPKPIWRFEFILGKFAGMLITLAVLMAVMSALLFGVLAIQASLSNGTSDGGVIARAELLLFFEVAVVTAVAVLFSSFSTPLLSGALTLGITVVGHFTPELRELIAKVDGAALRVLLRGGLRLFPDLHLYFVSGAMVSGHYATVHGTYVDWGYVAVAGLYGACYSACALALATVLFARRDFT